MENVADIKPPAIDYYGKRRIFHAVDHINTIKNDKTAQRERRPCSFVRAGSICSAKKQVFIVFPSPKSLTKKHNYSIENVAYSAYQR